MKTIYIDRQIVVSAYEGENDVTECIKNCKENGYIFPYSPAHIEEMAGSFCLEKRDDLEKQISHLNSISNGYAYMPSENGPAELRPENIEECLSRVKDNGGRLLTEIAVRISQDRHSKISNLYSGNKKQWEKLHRSIQKLPPNQVFSHPDIFELIEKMARFLRFRLLKDTYFDRLATMSDLFDVLNLFGSQTESSEKRLENRLHDISHSIYASYSNIFVTDDRKLRKSTEAIYHFTGIETHIIDKSTFLEMFRTT